MFNKEAENKEMELEFANADDFELLLTYLYGTSISVSECNVYSFIEARSLPRAWKIYA